MTDQPTGQPTDEAADLAAAGAQSEAEFLAGYDPARFAPVAVTVDVAVLTVRHGRLCVLLVQRAGHPFRGRWALPGGFVDAGEDLDDAARRELAEETGAAGGVHLEQLRSYGAPGRDPRMRVVSVAYVAFVPDAPAPQAGSDAAAARFWPVEDLGTDDGPSLAFDHDRIVADAVERARAKLEYTTLAARFVDDPFTISDLRRVYETVWGAPLEANNFRRKVLATDGFVVETGETVSLGRGRPAVLYRRGPASVLHPAMLRRLPSSGAAAGEAADTGGSTRAPR